MKLLLQDYKRIQKECFWDLDITAKDIKDIVKSNDLQKKKLLFEKILLNSTRFFYDLRIFDKTDLKLLLKEYKILKFNSEYALRRKNLVEVYFFDKPLLIDELKWVA